MELSIELALEAYALNAQRIKSLQEQQDSLKEVIVPALEDEPKLGATPFGKFKVTMYKKYSYLEPIVALEEELKSQKAQAISTGDATCEETPSLRFTPIKL